MVFGEFPPRHIDHINGDRSDNRIANLRLATVGENAQNRKLRSDNKAGLTGVHKQGKSWIAKIAIDGKRRHLGCFDTKDAAHSAYQTAKAELHKFQRSIR